MLERAAGCLENAGRRFFRDSNGAIRSRRAFYSSAVHYSPTNLELHHGVPITQSPQRPASNDLNAIAPSNDTRTPVLDFLYPLPTQEFAASCLLHAQRRLVPRRRRKTSPSLARHYTSQAPDLEQSDELDLLDSEKTSPFADEQDAKKTHVERLVPPEDDDSEIYDGAWDRYVAAGRPPQVNSALLAFLSRSHTDKDFRRARSVFNIISPESRSPEDYVHMVKSALATDRLLDAKIYCEEAISNGIGIKCWAFLLAHYVSDFQWDWAQEIWDLESSLLENDRARTWIELAPHFDMSTFEDPLVDLADFTRELTRHTSLHDLARFFFDSVCSSQDFVEKSSIDGILLVLQKYNNLNLLRPAHYINILNLLRKSESRQIFIRSVVIYRNYRWKMDGRVSAKLLGHLVRGLSSFQITTGLLYFLDEFTHFYGKPSLDAYKHALIAFSRAGDVDSVNDLFEKMVSQHGMPRSRRLVTPLLYVHARVGNVRETLRQFNRVPEEFGLRLNTVCWNILLTAYANAEDLSGCFKILRQMFDQHMDPNSHTFGIVMGLCANRGDIQGVRDLLELAKEYDVQITAPMIDTVVEAHCQNQEFEEAEEIAQTCLGLDIAGSRVRMWNVLLWNYAFRMDLEAIARVRSRMEEAALYPDGMTYAALMLSLVLVGKTESARRILRQLHRNNRAYATEFHYAIVLFGFVKSRNRDMVHVIFNEIQERFGEADLAARLLILKNQLRRDLQLLEHGGTDAAGAHNRLENAEKFLKETISEFHTRKMATKSPVLGAGRMSAKQAFPIAYYEHMMNAYGRRGASRRARELFDEYLQSQRISPSDDVAQVAPLRLLTALMLAHVRAFEKLELVEEYWDMAFKRAIKMISRPNIEAWFSNPSAPLPSEDDLLVWAEPRGDLSEANVGASDRGGFAILHAHRFMLSRALSLLMRSLAYRNEIGRISTVIMEVEKAGFVLTTHNWSTFVQLLASSGNESDQIEAFSLFEHKFMPNFPGWKYLRRGYGVKPHGVPSTIDSMEIKGQRGPSHLLGKEGKRYWSKIQPDFMQPTYVSMVYLAAALKQFRQKSIWKGAVDLEKINAVAPETLTAVAEMPRLGDKLQGVLLRGHEQRPERPPLERDQFVWTGGILRAGGLTKTYSYDEPLSEEPADEAQAAERVTEAEEVTDLEEAIPDIEEFRDLFRRTLERSDEFDLEVQAVVNRRRKAEGTTEELGDDEMNQYSQLIYDKPEDDYPDAEEYEASEEAQEEAQEEADGEAAAGPHGETLWGVEGETLWGPEDEALEKASQDTAAAAQEESFEDVEEKSLEGVWKESPEEALEEAAAGPQGETLWGVEGETLWGSEDETLEKASQEAAGTVQEEISDKNSQDTAAAAQEEPFEDVREELLEGVREESLEESTDEAEVAASEEPSKAPREMVSEELSEDTTVAAQEESLEEVLTERVQTKAPEEAFENAAQEKTLSPEITPREYLQEPQMETQADIPLESPKEGLGEAEEAPVQPDEEASDSPNDEGSEKKQVETPAKGHEEALKEAREVAPEEDHQIAEVGDPKEPDEKACEQSQEAADRKSQEEDRH